MLKGRNNFKKESLTSAAVCALVEKQYILKRFDSKNVIIKAIQVKKMEFKFVTLFFFFLLIRIWSETSITDGPLYL